MKYFRNITTAEEIKKQFRAYCVSMHPDKGGDPEEFKAMMAEYNCIIKNFERAKEEARAEEEARKAAEEARKEAEERKRKEEEEERKAAEALREVIAKWSSKLKTVKPASGWTEKPTADYLAAVKYNIKQILNKYFPGVVFKVSLKNKTWSATAEIFWTDGPTSQQVEEVEELNLFISHYHTCSPYEDYGHDEEMKSTRAWRNQYGQISADRFEFIRTFSDIGKDEVIAKIYEAFPQFEGMTKKSDAAFISFDDALHLCQLLGFHHKETGKAWADLSEEEREKRRAQDEFFDAQRKIIYDLESSRSWYNKKTSLGCVIDAFLKVYTISEGTTKAAAEAAAAPVFEPKHGATWQAIKKALGANVFCMSEAGSYHYKEITFYEAAEMVAKGETVYLGKPAMYDGERCIYGVNGGGAKVQQKRADKFAAVGVTISNYGYNSYKDVEILQFSLNVLTELRKDAEEVEKQRKQWEDEQKNGKRTAHKADRGEKAAKSATDEPEADEATAADAETCEQVEAVGVLASALSFLVGAIVSATEKANEALKKAAASAAAATAKYEAEHKTEERKEAAATLREQIKKVSEQVANLSDTLAQMQERLNALESGQDVSEEAAVEPETDETAQDGTTAQQGETTAQIRQSGGSGSGVSLDMLRTAAEDVERLTKENRHGDAVLSELYTLCACGVNVRDIIDEVRGLNTSETLGREPAEAIRAKRSKFRRSARNRAKVVLGAEEFRTLYTWDEGTDAGNGKAA